MSDERTYERSDNDYFRMGAAVAVGELYDSGRLGDQKDTVEMVRDFLGSFGLRSMGDIKSLGMTGPYLDDFRTVFKQD